MDLERLHINKAVNLCACGFGVGIHYFADKPRGWWYPFVQEVDRREATKCFACSRDSGNTNTYTPEDFGSDPVWTVLAKEPL